MGDVALMTVQFAPMPSTDFSGVHGNNERISVENMRRGTEVMIDLLETFTD